MTGSAICGDRRPKVPDAEIVVPAAELKWWTRPGVESLDLGPARKGLARRIQATVATWKNVRPFEENQNSCPACTHIQVPGHSPGMVAHLIASGGKQFLISADAVNWRPTFRVAACYRPGSANGRRNAKEDLRSRGRRQAHHFGYPLVDAECRLAGQGWQQLRIRSRGVIVRERRLRSHEGRATCLLTCQNRRFDPKRDTWALACTDDNALHGKLRPHHRALC